MYERTVDCVYIGGAGLAFPVHAAGKSVAFAFLGPAALIIGVIALGLGVQKEIMFVPSSGWSCCSREKLAKVEGHNFGLARSV